LHHTEPELKRNVAILLTLIVCFNTVGYFFVFKAKELQIKYEVKKLIKESVPETQLIVIRLTPGTRFHFNWIHEKEFRYKGNMYDIVKKKEVYAGVTDYYCLRDDREAGLFRNLNTFVKEMMNGNNQTARINNLFSLFLSGFFPPVNISVNFTPVTTTLRFGFLTVLYAYRHFSDIPHPPKH